MPDLITLIRPGTDGFLILCLSGLFLLVNLMAYIAFALDKRRATLGQWRVSERFLLMLALFGGWLGAKLAQRRIRHKTRKQPFRRRLNQIGMLHFVAVALAFWQAPAVAPFSDHVANFASWANTTLTDIGANLHDAANQSRGSGTDKSALPHRFGPGAADQSAIPRF